MMSYNIGYWIIQSFAVKSEKKKFYQFKFRGRIMARAHLKITSDLDTILARDLNRKILKNFGNDCCM